MTTSTLHHATAATLVLAASALLAACSDKPAMATAAQATAPSAVHAPAHTTVPPAALKANGSGIQVGADVASAAPLQSLAVTLQFSGVTTADATASLGTDTGLRIESGGNAFSLPVGNSRHAVQVVADETGLFYLHVTTVQNGRGSVTSVPVQVGNAPQASQKLQAPGQLKTGAGDIGKVVVMPVP